MNRDEYILKLSHKNPKKRLKYTAKLGKLLKKDEDRKVYRACCGFFQEILLAIFAKPVFFYAVFVGVNSHLFVMREIFVGQGGGLQLERSGGYGAFCVCK